MQFDVIDLGFCEYQEALDICLRHIEKRPGDSQLKWQRATLLYKLNKNDEALTAFHEVIVEEPSWRDDANKFISEIESKT